MSTITSTSTSDGTLHNPEVDFAKLNVGPWDGRKYAYIPRIDLPISPTVDLHEDFDLELDPISYQVIRNRFWNMNLDHSDTVKRVSGSPLIVSMDDFNTALLTENGDTIVCGPSIQYFTGHADHIVKWTLEHRSDNPGIEDGDVFIQNDPYIGCSHQMDTAVYAPIYWEGKLFSWVLNCCHIGDIGGTVPGSFVPDAPDIYFESTPVPPTKLVRGGEMQRDVAEGFMRKSRLPDLIALQLRSQIAGIRLIRARTAELLEEFGPTVVKGVMRRIIRDCSVAVGERLEAIPDGRWAETIYIGSAGPEDRTAHRLVTSIEKRGDRLHISNAGTDPQFVAASCTYNGWRSAVLCAASSLLAWDQRYCPAGVGDHIEFEPTPGVLNCATYPAAVSAGTSNIVSVYSGSQAISKMLLAGPEELRNRANASGGVSLPGWWVASGTDRNGNFVADLTGDSLNGALGAFPFRDGIDTGGAWWWPRSVSGNAEEWEAALPILYLFRLEQRDSGAPGYWRGGNGVQIAVTPHKSDDLMVTIVSTDPGVNCSPGIGGGYPGHPGNYLLASDPGLGERFAESSFPSDPTQLAEMLPSLARVSPKATFPLGKGDVFLVEYSAGGAYGDSLRRDPELVADDVLRDRVSVDDARRSYGVVLDGDGRPDLDATAAERARTVEARLARASGGATPGEKIDLDGAEVIASPWYGLLIVEHDGAPTWACSHCGQALGPGERNYKLSAAAFDADPHDVDPGRYPRPADFCDEEIVLRTFLCPGCGALFGREICKPADEPTWDVRIDLHDHRPG